MKVGKKWKKMRNTFEDDITAFDPVPLIKLKV